jgi:hypothetical protein
VHAAILASINLYIDLRNDALPRQVVPTMPEALIDFIDRS